MTTALYYRQPYRQRFTATITAIHSAPYAVELDRSCFYPGGGGQPADRGAIGGIRVVALHRQQEHVLHQLETTPEVTPGAPFTIGEQVECALDWRHRYDYMQQHTGQHILSAMLVKVGGWNTLSVHLGSEYSAIEVDASGISEQDLRNVAGEANRAICGNHAVRDYYVQQEQLESLALRRAPTVSGTVRIVEIDSIDRVACGGIHTQLSSEVGLVFSIGSERIRGHVRTLWKIGQRAFDDWQAKSALTQTLIQCFSVPQGEIADRVRALVTHLEQSESERRALEQRLAEALAGSLIANAKQIRAIRFFSASLQEQSPALFAAIAARLAATPNICACIVNLAPQQEKMRWAICDSSATFDNDSLRALLPPGARGGGRPPLWQGSGVQDNTHAAARKKSADQLRAAFDEYVRARLSQRMPNERIMDAQ